MEKNKKKTEANLISFKVLLTKKNEIITELSQLPEKHIDNIFQPEEAWIVRNVIKKCKEKITPLHSYLQKELQSLQER